MPEKTQYTYIILILILTVHSCTIKESHPPKIDEVEFLEYVSGSSTNSYQENGHIFLKKTLEANYSVSYVDSIPLKTVYDQVDSIMCNLYSDTLKNFNTASFRFFKRTLITNNASLGRNKRKFLDHSETNDMLVTYEWNKGVFFARHEHYTGSIFPINSTWNKWIYDCPHLYLNE